jgi:hypothetical protein
MKTHAEADTEFKRLLDLPPAARDRLSTFTVTVHADRPVKREEMIQAISTIFPWFTIEER